ncbi:hypothetical protein [Enterococcus gallinarum]|nr:hypothetical protein [Enterococcus gallinarum]
MTPTQESIRKLSDKELDVQQKIVQSLRRRVPVAREMDCCGNQKEEQK